MRQTSVLLMLIAFGSIMLVTTAQAQESVESVYCRFDVKKWDGSLLKFLKQGSECKVKVQTRYGAFEYDQPVVPDLGNYSPLTLWEKYTDG